MHAGLSISDHDLNYYLCSCILPRVNLANVDWCAQQWACGRERMAMKKTPGALVLVVVAVAAVATLIACGGGSPKVALVAYSTPREAYAELIPAFQKTAAGANVAFSESYGSSGEQSRAVEAGLPADVVGFSLAPDMARLVGAGLVLSLTHISEPTRLGMISYAVFCLKKK